MMDLNKNCDSLKDSLVAFLGANMEVTTANGRCIVTLPVRTLDDRFINVYVEPKLGSYVLVHDGGKSIAELFAQGIHLSDGQAAHMKAVARRYGATFQNDMFTCGAHSDSVELQVAILAIAQCAAMAMVPVLSHEAVVEDEPISARVARTLNRWKPDYVDIRRNFSVRGTHADHRFEFVTFARRKESNTVALRILLPGYGSRVQAHRYGFMIYDLQQRQEIDRWQKLVIIPKREEWQQEDVNLVKSLASEVIELETDEDERIEGLLPGIMTELTEAA